MAPAQTFQDHLKELRRRILWVVLAIGVSAGLGYILRVRIIHILQRPLGAPLYYTSPAGSFNFILKLSLVIGVFVALPVMIYQLLRFLEPALPIAIKRSTLIKLIGSSFLLAAAGVCFGFFLMIPLSLHFFLGYSTAQIKPLITADEYLSFVLNHMLTFALAFQIPMIFLFINRIKPLKPSKLLKYQRHVIVGAFALAIVLPFTYDPLSQFIVAIPIVFLYYLSVILLWVANRGRNYQATAHVEPTITLKTETPPALEFISGTEQVPVHVPKAALPVVMPLSPAGPVQTRQVKRLRPIDGFLYTARITPAIRTFKTNVVPTAYAPTSTPSPQPAQRSITKPRLSIDGILPPLTA